MNERWKNKIKAFLHDPPDKALILGYMDHIERASELWYEIGFKEDAERLRRSKLRAFNNIHKADTISSAMQRLDLPQELWSYPIYFKDKKVVFKHTLSGKVNDLREIKKYIEYIKDYGKTVEKYGFNKKEMKKFIDKYKLKDKDYKKVFLILWRFLPEEYSHAYFLPADTRIPDHSIWDHLDVSSAVFPFLDELSLIAVKLPAVQEFISHARKLSDLWAGSHIYSTIIFAGIRAIADKYGYDTIIYPQLRGNPLVDFYEFSEFVNKDDLGKRLLIANIPNVFLAFAKYSEAEGLCREIKKSIMNEWKEISNKAREILKEMHIDIDVNIWNKQIEKAVEVTCAYIKFFDQNKFNNIKDDLPEDLKDIQERWLELINNPNEAHFYSLTYEILGISLAQKSRFWNAWEEKPITGKKCLMCGRRNAVIERKEIYYYWNNGWKEAKLNKDILKENERLCAVCLTKRLYGYRAKSVFEKIFGDKPPKSESVVHIAARDFIEKAEEHIKKHENLKGILKLDIENIYLENWAKKLYSDEEEAKNYLKNLYEKYGKPNKYYAILMMDGDEIGKTLSGEKLLNFDNYLHDEFKNEVVKYKPAIKETERILTPSHHIAISRAMKDFSLHVVPKIVEKYKGFLVYAGGDDVLALFPADKVLDAAYEIQEYFKKDFYTKEDLQKIGIHDERVGMIGLGNRASMSAGIVFAHYKWPLYDAMERVREAEKKAKNEYERNAFCMTFIKRSGEILTAGGKWEFKEFFDQIIDALSPKEEKKRKLSHRFIYDLIDIIERLKKNDDKWEEPFISMLKAEIKRLLKRRNYKNRLKKDEIEKLHREVFCNLLGKYLEKDLPLKDIGISLKILYDAYRGGEI